MEDINYKVYVRGSHPKYSNVTLQKAYDTEGNLLKYIVSSDSCDQVYREFQCRKKAMHYYYHLPVF